jgi:hypothetical protein
MQNKPRCPGPRHALTARPGRNSPAVSNMQRTPAPGATWRAAYARLMAPVSLRLWSPPSATRRSSLPLARPYELRRNSGVRRSGRDVIDHARAPAGAPCLRYPGNSSISITAAISSTTDALCSGAGWASGRAAGVQSARQSPVLPQPMAGPRLAPRRRAKGVVGIDRTMADEPLQVQIVEDSVVTAQVPRHMLATRLDMAVLDVAATARRASVAPPRCRPRIIGSASVVQRRKGDPSYGPSPCHRLLHCRTPYLPRCGRRPVVNRSVTRERQLARLWLAS